MGRQRLGRTLVPQQPILWIVRSHPFGEEVTPFWRPGQDWSPEVRAYKGQSLTGAPVKGPKMIVSGSLMA